LSVPYSETLRCQRYVSAPGNVSAERPRFRSFRAPPSRRSRTPICALSLPRAEAFRSRSRGGASKRRAECPVILAAWTGSTPRRAGERRERAPESVGSDLAKPGALPGVFDGASEVAVEERSSCSRTENEVEIASTCSGEPRSQSRSRGRPRRRRRDLGSGRAGRQGTSRALRRPRGGKANRRLLARGAQPVRRRRASNSMRLGT
jgi:hypothetical protein